MMNNRDVLIILCSKLCVGKCHKPFTNVEISKIIEKLKEKDLELKDLYDKDNETLSMYFFNSNNLEDNEISFIERLQNLLSRLGSMAFEITELKDKGIHLLTIFDDDYPSILKQKLGSSKPAILYYSGNIKLLSNKYIGFSGSRLKKQSENIIKKYTDSVTSYVEKITENGYGTITGGAMGIDSIASQSSASMNGYFVEFLSDSLIKRIKLYGIAKAIQDDKCLIISEVIPDAPFNVGNAMARNKYIYLLSQNTIVVAANYSVKNGKKTGGTWNGAIENLKSDYTNILVMNDIESSANQELINAGAISVSCFADENSLSHLFTSNKYELDKNKIKELSKVEKIKCKKIKEVDQNQLALEL